MIKTIKGHIVSNFFTMTSRWDTVHKGTITTDFSYSLDLIWGTDGRCLNINRSIYNLDITTIEEHLLKPPKTIPWKPNMI